MTKLLVPILLVLLAVALVPKVAQAPGAEINQGVRLFGYELRIGVSVQPVPAVPAAPVVADSLVDARACTEEGAR